MRHTHLCVAGRHPSCHPLHHLPCCCRTKLDCRAVESGVRWNLVYSLFSCNGCVPTGANFCSGTAGAHACSSAPRSRSAACTHAQVVFLHEHSCIANCRTLVARFTCMWFNCCCVASCIPFYRAAPLHRLPVPQQSQCDAGSRSNRRLLLRARELDSPTRVPLLPLQLTYNLPSP